MTERTHKASLSQSQGREGWSVIFRHPVLLDRTTGKPGRRVRRGLGTKDEKVAKRLIAELNELLADKLYWEPSSRATALTRFSPLVVDIFYHDMMPEHSDAFTDREIASAVRVEYTDDDGGREVAIFDGPRALERAARFASSFYGRYSDPEGLTAKP